MEETKELITTDDIRSKVYITVSYTHLDVYKRQGYGCAEDS